MIWLLVALVAVAVVGGAMAVAIATQQQRSRAERLQIVPGVATRAPVAWAGAHTLEARLHRRLGEAVRSMHAAPASNSPMLTEQRHALEQEAVRIDARLIAVAALTGVQRAPAIERVGELVERYESAVADLVSTSLDDPSALEAAISESEIRLRALEAARAEVEQIDRQQ